MEAIFNTKTKQLYITDPEIKEFDEIVPADYEQDYWNCLYDKSNGKAIYDINLYIYNNEYNLQSVNLIDNNEGEIIIGDDYKTIQLTII